MERRGKFGWILSNNRSPEFDACSSSNRILRNGTERSSSNQFEVRTRRLNPSPKPFDTSGKNVLPMSFLFQHPLPNGTASSPGTTFLRNLYYISDRFESNSNTIYIRAFRPREKREKQEKRRGGGCKEDHRDD